MNANTIVFEAADQVFFLQRDDYDHQKLTLWDTTPLSMSSFPRPGKVLVTYTGSEDNSKVAHRLFRRCEGYIDESCDVSRYIQAVQFLREST